MTEKRRSKASELAYDLSHRSLSEDEKVRRGLILPELRLRPDIPAIDIDETTPIVQALSYLEREDNDSLALREPSGEPRAIVLSPERYLELVGKEINAANKVGTLDGRIVPEQAAFVRAHVEQVDPHDNWGDQPSATTV